MELRISHQARPPANGGCPLPVWGGGSGEIKYPPWSKTEPLMEKLQMNSYKASDKNDVNGSSAASVPASGRSLEVPSTVIKRNPQRPTSTQDCALTTSFRIRRIVGDGNCLFRAISLYVHNTQERHIELRSDAVLYVRRHWNELKDHLLLRPGESSDQRSYVYRMRQAGTYGTSVEILAMSEILKQNFVIYAEDHKIGGDKYITNQTPTVISKTSHQTNIHLLLTGNLESGHYELLEADEQKMDNSKNRTSGESSAKKTQIKSQIPLHKQLLPAQGIRETEEKTHNRVKWTIEEYKEIIFCHYYMIEKTGTANLKDTLELWKERNPNSTHELTANKMGTQRRYILNNRKLTQCELDEIIQKVKIFINQEVVDTTEVISSDREESIIIEVNPDEKPSDINTTEECNTLTHREEMNEYVEMREIMKEVGKQIQADDSTEEHIWRQPLKKLNDNSKLREQIRLANKALEEIITNQPDEYQNITMLNKLIYATAKVIQDKVAPPLKPSNKQRKSWTDEPPWKKRIRTQIAELRRDLSQLKEVQQSELSDKMRKLKEMLYKKYKIKTPKDHTKLSEHLKQKVAAKACRIKRYTERSAQYQQNKMFSENTCRFYNTIMGKTYTANITPSKQEVECFWKDIWEQDTSHNATAPWIQREYEKTAKIDRMEWDSITETELKIAINAAANWKAPGVDGITNFWLKTLTATHASLAYAFNNLIANNHNMPLWLTKGKTFLIPKNEKTELAKNYRPITCLNNIYKLLTKIISERLYQHLTTNNLFPAEQKGCTKNTYGCKDHLLTSKMLQKDCKQRNRDMSIAWIDYKKAFDKVPHTWIIEALNIYRAPLILQSFISKTMQTWNTDLYLPPEHKNNTRDNKDNIIENIKIKSGIYQGDSLSPLLFCVTLFPLSSILNNTNKGYQCKYEREKVNHLLYVDDLKLIAQSDEELAEQLVVVKGFSDDVRMEFGLDKCAKATFIKGRLHTKQNIKIDDTVTIRGLDQVEVYKYLGIDEHDGIQHKKMKTKLKKEYYRRIRLILKTELSAKNKMIAITSLAVPVIQYSLEIIKWTQKEIRKLDTQTRKLLTMYGALHPRADVDRLYIPRKVGGRGMINIETSHYIAKKGLCKYLELKVQDKYLGMVFRHQHQSRPKEFDSTDEDKEEEVESEEELEKREGKEGCAPKTLEVRKVREIKQSMKQKIKEERIKNWRNKRLHGQIANEAIKDTINQNSSWAWLTHAGLKTETEALITACQDQAIATNYVKAKIMKTGNDPKCRLCRSFSETIHHIVAGCPILAKKEYLERHNTVAKQLHWNICKHYNIEVNDKWYLHTPDPVVDLEEVTIIWDAQIQTDRTIPANKPDVIVKDKKQKQCLIIDVAIPSDYNITQKEAEKRLKYKDLQIEIQRMWKLKARVIPVIIGATGLISKDTTEIMREVPGKHNLLQMQKAVVLSTAHIVRKAL